MAAPQVIVDRTLVAARRSKQFAGKKIVVSAGPTREPIDPVRFISNRSSGKMGYALAAAAARRGAQVVLVSGPVDLPLPFGVERVVVETSAQMNEAMSEARNGAEAVFMAAAVSDYIPRYATSKIKKSGAGLTLQLEDGPDILAGMGGDRRERILVGFAAETDDLLTNARAKLERKGVDYIVANDVSRADIGMDADDNAVIILGRDGQKWDVPKASKMEIAEAILDRVLVAVPVGGGK
jgi:phosphopantothenoylcysteine decarboxylase/phosphopantothenate--cysteine ligase